MSRKRKSASRINSIDTPTDLAATRLLTIAWLLATDTEVCPICMMRRAFEIMSDAESKGYISHGTADPNYADVGGTLQ